MADARPRPDSVDRDAALVQLCHMVCNNCGHIDIGPERGTYECEKCGHGDGWGYGTDDKVSAEKKSAAIITRGRLDG